MISALRVSAIVTHAIPPLTGDPPLDGRYRAPRTGSVTNLGTRGLGR
jgi:hypothetical protein